MKMPPWSYSSLSAFETCPYRYWLTRVVKKVSEPPTTATVWGNKVHKALEDRLMKNTPLPTGTEQYQPLVDALCAVRGKGRILCEERITLSRNLTPTTWKAPNAWWRGIIDVVVDGGKRVFLGDWKTGKPKEDHDQLKLFAASYMAQNPRVEEARTGYIWLAHGKMTRLDIHKDETPGIWEEFIVRTDRMQAAYDTDKWVKKPSGLCNGWCPAQGHCEFWAPKRNK